MKMKGGMLRFWILKIVDKNPMRGADIISEMEKRSHGHWRPSPGSVYPSLSGMEDNNLVVRMNDGKYEITEKGKEEIVKYDYFVNDLVGPKDKYIIDEIISNLKYILETKEEGFFQKDDLKRLKVFIKEFLHGLEGLEAKNEGEDFDDKDN